ncbi:hypothetical protein [Tsukamurella sp. PLM1]|uniref:hypothetical protein n=1 Tax=Tsukamurella sp. PLM1 TaxID=2929795 RepID=UPI0035302F84
MHREHQRRSAAREPLLEHRLGAGRFGPRVGAATAAEGAADPRAERPEDHQQ